MKHHISVLIRCDGSPALGMGHLSRCRVLADALLAEHSCRVIFSARERETQDRLAGQGYPVFQRPGRPSSDYGPWLEDAALTTEANVLVLDVRDGPPLQSLKNLKRQGMVLVTIDDASPARLLADLAFYPPVPQTARLNWAGFSGRRCEGWEWVIVDRHFCQASPRRRRGRPVVLITMGASDPRGLTLKAVRAIDSLEENCDPWVVLGPHFSQQGELESLLGGCQKRFRQLRDVRDMPAVMAQADLAVASFGVTAYELAASGVPALYLCLTPDHAQSASALMEEGVAICLGVHQEVSEGRLARAVAVALRDKQGRRRMGDRARSRIDGEGANRIAGTIVERVQSGG